MNLSRRNFLKFSSLAAGGVLLPDPPRRRYAEDAEPRWHLGRTVYSMRYYAEPTASSQELGFYNTDAVVDIYEAREGDPKPEPTNPVWLRTGDGWIHSSYVQPVRYELNEHVADVRTGGFLAQVTVPYTQAWDFSERRGRRVYRFYYGTTHWVTWSSVDERGVGWYRVVDDLKKERVYSVQSAHMRRVPPEQLSPLYPNASEKRVEVDLTAQRVSAYADGKMVFTTQAATGAGKTETPLGEFRVERKQPSRHMASAVESNGFDLPGVPYVCFIEWTGVSLHGTYWHNNYGTVMSHGCINMTPEAARWIYRFTDPVVPADDNYVESDLGTPVIVF